MVKTKKKRGSIPKYEGIKEELLNMILSRARLHQIEARFNISKNTAMKYRAMLLEEMGELTDQRIKDIRRDFITKSVEEVEISKRTLLGIITDKKAQSPQKVNAINSMTGVLKTQMELLNRFRVVDAESVKIETDYSLADAYADYKKREKDKAADNRTKGRKVPS